MTDLRRRGYRFALDDLGAGHSGIGALVRLAPDFVKLDMGLIRGIDVDARMGRMVRHLQEFATGERMTLVAEGIETESELAAVTALGCAVGQGYLFGKPVLVELPRLVSAGD
jgi:EAL domain-containing protein (putative c-di-GMP-specific phosphodiesterase class I)